MHKHAQTHISTLFTSTNTQGTFQRGVFLCFLTDSQGKKSKNTEPFRMEGSHKSAVRVISSSTDSKLGQSRALWLSTPWWKKERQECPLQLGSLQGPLRGSTPLLASDLREGGYHPSQRAERPLHLSQELNAPFRHSDRASIFTFKFKVIPLGRRSLLSFLRTEKNTYKRLENKALSDPFLLKHLRELHGPVWPVKLHFCGNPCQWGKKISLTAKGTPPPNDTFLIW